MLAASKALKAFGDPRRVYPPRRKVTGGKRWVALYIGLEELAID
jgi:hypothetical protein